VENGVLLNKEDQAEESDEYNDFNSQQ